jgi:hypothetical protein
MPELEPENKREEVRRSVPVLPRLVRKPLEVQRQCSGALLHGRSRQLLLLLPLPTKVFSYESI